MITKPMPESKRTPIEANSNVELHHRPAYLTEAFPQFAPQEIYLPWIIEIQNRFVPDIVWKKEHSDRNAYLTGKLAEHVRLAPGNILTGIRSGLVHDGGFTVYNKIPIDYTNKPADLTREEYQAIQSHVRLGFDLINSHNPLIAKTMAAHHEIGTQKPYPRKYPELKEDEEWKEEWLQRNFDPVLYELQKLVALSDIIDTLMSHDRPYRVPLTAEQTFTRLTRPEEFWITPEGKQDHFGAEIVMFATKERAKLDRYYPLKVA